MTTIGLKLAQHLRDQQDQLVQLVQPEQLGQLVHKVFRVQLDQQDWVQPEVLT
jgi:hypothetical protein